jgi:hypothetical protein
VEDGYSRVDSLRNGWGGCVRRRGDLLFERVVVETKRTEHDELCAGHGPSLIDLRIGGESLTSRRSGKRARSG